MMRYIKMCFLGWALILLSNHISYASEWNLDTRVSAYYQSQSKTWLLSRVSSISFEGLPLLGIKFDNHVYGSLGIKGTDENWRIGTQIFKQFSLFWEPLMFTPFIGMSISSSTLASNSLAMNFGFLASIRLISWLEPCISMNLTMFNDWSLEDHYAGLKFPIFSSLKIGLLYNWLVNATSSFTGFGAIVSFDF